MTQPKQNLADFLMESPLRGSGIALERIKDYPDIPEFLIENVETVAAMQEGDRGEVSKASGIGEMIARLPTDD